MTEPVYRWEPVTDLYKEKAPETADIEAEKQLRIQELHEANRRKPRTVARAPLGIRIFSWYYFGRSAVCLLLLIILFSFPKSSPSIWLSDNISNFLRIPGSKSEQDARRQQAEKISEEYGVPEDDVAVGRPLFNAEMMGNIVIVYLALNVVTAAVVGFMWWDRSWKVRWVTMFYAGALVAKVAVNVLVAGIASVSGSGTDSSQTTMLVITVGFNSSLFLYLAFWPGVEQWFDSE